MNYNIDIFLQNFLAIALNLLEIEEPHELKLCHSTRKVIPFLLLTFLIACLFLRDLI